MLDCACCFMLVLMSTQCVGSQREAEEFLKAYCVDCHTGPDSRGQLDFVALLSGSAEREFEAWENVADRVSSRSSRMQCDSRSQSETNFAASAAEECQFGMDQLAVGG
ncbi:MAG: hypothetical protein ACPGXX_20665 [Planctomycetaceae bacterium]